MQRIERVILVHGTGASAPSDEGSAWWQRSGILRSTLAERAFTLEGFIWSGENSERARRTAGRELATHIQSLAAAGELVHLIGHSHGGSVIVHALTALPQSLRQVVLSWTTVGTPFLSYGVRLPRLVFDALVFYVSCVVLMATALALHEVDLPLAWEHDRALTALWFTILLLPLVSAISAGVKLVPFALHLLQRGAVLKLAEEREKHLALWSRQDEPIIGLCASGSFSLRVLKGGTLERLGAIFSPLATATNQFVNNMVSRALQGSNIAHLEMLAASSSPDPELAHHPLPQEIDDELVARANKRSAALGLRVREILASGRDPVTGFSDLQRSAATAFTFNELVHTTYFQNKHCINLILHHVLSRSELGPGSKLDGSHISWYRNRFDSASRPPLHPLPSNRMGFAVAGGLAAFSVTLALSIVGLVELHGRVLAPTTASFHLVDLINARRLAVALGGILPAEEIEQAGSGEVTPFSTVYSPYDNSTPDLSTLKPYVQSIVQADQLELLTESVFLLDAPELRTLFYSHALPLVLDVANREQVLWLAQSGLLPGPRVPKGFNDFHVNPEFLHPGIDVFLFSTASRGLLDAQMFATVVSACPRESHCKQRAQLTASRALTKAGRTSQFEFLLPLPEAFQLVELRAPGDTARIKQRERLMPLWSLNAEDLPYIVWLARNSAWDHLATYTQERSNISWNEVDSAVRIGLENAEGETVNHILFFITNTRWSDAVPVDIIQRANALLNKQIVPSNSQTPQVKLRTFERFVKREEAKRPCSTLTGIDPAALESHLDELKEQGANCRNETLQHHRQRRAMENLERVREASSLFGEEGFLQTFARLRVGDLPKDLVAEPRKELFFTLRKAMCKPVDGPEDFDTEDLDRTELATALRTLGRPLVDDPDVAAWWELIFKESPCKNWLTAEEADREEALKLARAITFEIADWLDSEDPGNSLKWMQELSGTAHGLVTTFMREPGVEDFASWFHSRQYSTDVLYVTHQNASRYRLMRRAALYRLASCELAYERPRRADQLALVAARSGERVAQNAAPREAIEAIRAEAHFYALRYDPRWPPQTAPLMAGQTAPGRTVGL